MPRKYQNPKLQVRDDVPRPYYYVRVIVPRITAEGRRRVRENRILGYCDQISRKRAMELRAEQLEQVNQGRLVAPSLIRFKDLAARYLETRLPQLGVGAQAKYRVHLKNHLLPGLGELKLSEIDRSLLEQFLASKAETLAWWTRNDLRGILSGLFSAARDWKWSEGPNPAKGVRIGRKKFAREKRLLSLDELRTLLGALQGQLRFLVVVLVGLNLRISEALALKWSDVDFTEGVISIRRRWYRGDLSEDGENKTEASTGELRMGASLAAELARRDPGPGRRDEFLFVGEDGKNPPDDRDLLRFELRPVLKRLGLYQKGLGWHAFRRAGVTYRQSVGGATALEARHAARHASVDMTLLYTLADAERETAQQQRVMEELLGAPAPKKPARRAIAGPRLVERAK